MGGEGADHAADGAAVVQCVAACAVGRRGGATSPDAAMAAAACGASVTTLRRHSAKPGALEACGRRPKLPSVVTDLCFTPAGEDGTSVLSLAAATLHSGAFVWVGEALRDACAPPALHLACAGAIQTVAPIASCGATLPGGFVGRCGDRSVRLWSAPPMEAGGARDGAIDDAPDGAHAAAEAIAPMITPMTLGGLSAGPRSGTQVATAALLPAPREASDAPSDDVAAETLLVMADGAAGLVSWRLAAELTQPRGAEDEALGVDSRRAGRTALPQAQRVHCIALRPTTPTTLACGADDGAAWLLSLESPRDGPHASAHAEAPRWGAARQLVVRTATAAMGAARAPAVVQLTWSADGEWLYAGTADGSVHAVRRP